MRNKTSIVAVASLTMAVNLGIAANAAGSSPLLPATVSVDFGQSLGALQHSERLNNFSVDSTFATQRPSDVSYLNSQGLHGSIYRVWINSPNQPAAPCTTTTGTCTLDVGFNSYLTDAENVSDALLANLRLDNTYGFMTAGGPAAAEPMIERLLLAIKQAHPKVTYIEAWNEPDAPGTTIQAAQVYPYYAPVYQAVNNVNAELSATVPNYVPLKVGGPAFAVFNPSWLSTFLNAYVADINPAKRLDFISYHGYYTLDANQNMQFLNANPNLVAGQRVQLENMLAARGLSTNIPSYVTETGIYPGPMCDMCDSTDYVRAAAGAATLQYWFASQRLTYPFDWCVRHRNQGLKDELVTRNATGSYLNLATQQTLWPNLNPIPTNIFTPFGNVMQMQSMMKTERVWAVSDSLTVKGIGVYATASMDNSGAALMVWNYQGCSGTIPNVTCPTARYHTTIAMTHLPLNLRSRPVEMKMFRVDQSTSNYFADPAHPGLQLVQTMMFVPRNYYNGAIDLEPNAVYLIVLTPKS